MSLPDISSYGPWIALAGVIMGAAVGGVTIYFKFKRKRPDIRLKCTASNWKRRREYIDIYATFLLQNKGEVATTINNLTMTIFHNGNSYTTIPAERDVNIMLEPGASTPKQFKFVISGANVALDGPMERATVAADTLHGKSKSVQIMDIQQQQ